MTESIYIVLWVSAVVFILSGLDDLFIDISYWIFRKKYKINLPDLNEIKNAPEHPFALVIGCWQEYPVIARTISLALNKVKYTKILNIK